MINIDKIKEYAEALRILIQAYTGRKPIGQKVAVLANPQNPKSMSILSKAEAKYVATASYLTDSKVAKKWGGLFDCTKVRATEIMAVSPSIEGEGREQVIAFIGALGGEGMLKKLGLMKTEIKGET